MKFSSLFIFTLLLFSLLVGFYRLYSTETVQAQLPSSFNVEDSKTDMMSGQGNQYYSFQINPIVIDVKEIGISNVKNESFKSLSNQIAEDNYSNYLKAVTDNSVNLTRTYQDKIALWNSHNYSNITMAKITETFLPKFITQLYHFSNTDAPAKYSKVKENYAKSFVNEIQSYEYFKDYLITNNSTANKLSNDHLSAALNYETIARKAFAEANNISNTSTDKENNSNQQQALQQHLVTSQDKNEQLLSNL